MVTSTKFTSANFLTVIGQLLYLNICPPLRHSGGYPKCTNYKSEKFDFIIVGGGAAGCVLANRLSKNPAVNVLLLEEGDHPPISSEIPAEFIFLQRTPYDYNYTMTQPNMFQGYKDNLGRMPQGRLLGGGTGINAMIATKGVPYDYNRWADTISDPEWSYNNLKPYFAKVSTMVKTTKYTALRSARLKVDLAARNLGYSVNDPNDILGYHEVPIMVYEDTRNSMARAYLKPIANRPNLCVVVGKTVTKIEIDPQTKKTTGVKVQDGNNPIIITAIREVIISAGAINSPKLLMLSGIGPSEHLTQLGIDVLQDLPVGRLLDHFYVPIFAQTPSILGYPTRQEYLKSYCTLGFPMQNIDLSNFVGFINTEGDKTHPNVEIIHASFLWKDQVFFPQANIAAGYAEQIGKQLRSTIDHYGIFLMAVSLLHPKSQGSVSLKSSDPKSAPIILSNYLSHSDDSKTLIDVILSVVEPMMKTLPFALTKLLRLDLPKCDSIPTTGEYYESRDYWECYLRHLGTSELHPIATCRMGSNRSNSVLDNHFRVWGIQNLRVVDTSAIPITISGNPTIPVTMMSEKAADIILKDHNLK